jgi:hypothetical protein
MAQAEKGTPPSVVTSPPRHFGPNAPPSVYVFDPDIVIVDPLFTQYVQGNTPIKRLWTGALWSEGPAWSAQGRYLGVTVWTPEGKLIGRIRLPENTANLCFGGPKRDRRLWPPASRSTRSMSGPKGRHRDDRRRPSFEFRPLEFFTA